MSACHLNMANIEEIKEHREMAELIRSLMSFAVSEGCRTRGPCGIRGSRGIW